MNEQSTSVSWRTTGILLGAAVLVALGGTWAASATGIFERPAPEPTAVVQEESTPAPTITPTATPTPTLAPVVEPVVEAPPVEETPVEQPGPILCPSGTQANSNDGVNDTSCLPDVCWSIPVPDPAHPECDAANPPEYYY